MVTIITEDEASTDDGVGSATSVSVARGGAGKGRSALLGISIGEVLPSAAAVTAAAEVTPERTTVTLTVITALRDCAAS